MHCFHCGGQHDSSFCPGYGIRSLIETTESVRLGIDQLGELSEDAVVELCDAIDGGARQTAGAIRDGAAQTVDAIRDGLEQTVNAIRGGTNQTVQAIDRSTIVNAVGLAGVGVVSAIGTSMVREEVAGVRHELERIRSGLDEGIAEVSDALIGIGSVLDYRERMDELRHEAKLALEEEKSVAGQARRAIEAATLLLPIDLDQAHAFITKAIELFPTAADGFRIRGIIESMLEDHNAATKSLQMAVELARRGKVTPSLRGHDDPSGSTQRKALASASMQLSHELVLSGETDIALKVLTRSLRDLPNHPDLIHGTVKILVSMDRYDGSYESAIRTLVLESPRHFNLLYLGRQFTQPQRHRVRETLLRIQDTQAQHLFHRSSYLAVASGGRSQFPNQIEHLWDHGHPPFAVVMKMLQLSQSESKRWMTSSSRRQGEGKK